MEDFASAAMMRLIDIGLRRQGLAGPARTPAAALVPLADKRGQAEALLDRHGPLPLLRIGEAIDDAPDEATLVALILARSPADLIGRWQRLERFVHSRHRTRIVAQAETRLLLQHVALAPHPRPRRSEDLLVMGLLTALLRRIGTVDLKARPDGATAWGFAGGGWHDIDYPRDVSTWEFVWSAVRTGPHDAVTARPADDWTAAARGKLADDPGRSWTVALLARELNTSTRSLQRRLTQDGTKFSQLLAETRLAAASRLLGTATASVAEIGYACGFADQAHFTRAFKRHTGITPSRYKAQFALQP